MILNVYIGNQKTGVREGSGDMCCMVSQDTKTSWSRLCIRWSNYKDWIQPSDDNSPSVRHKHVIISVDCL